MTVICGKVESDGVVLAADSQATHNDMILSDTRKLLRTNQWLLGHAGDARVYNLLSDNRHGLDLAMGISDLVQKIKDLFRVDGMNLKPHPDNEACEMSGQHFLITEGTNLYFVGGAFSVHEIPDFMAIGCGRSYALGALAVGGGVTEAIEAACRFDPYCSGEIQRYRLDRVREAA